MKLTPCVRVVHFINILQAGFAPVFFHKEFTKPNCNQKKAGENTFVQKKLFVKCW
jgi:hypothetical protein